MYLVKILNKVLLIKFCIKKSKVNFNLYLNSFNNFTKLTMMIYASEIKAENGKVTKYQTFSQDANFRN